MSDRNKSGMSPKNPRNVPGSAGNVPKMSPGPSPDDIAIVHPFKLELESEYVPEFWTDTYVAERLIAAIKVVRALPARNLFPSEGAGFWPRYPYEWEDLLAQNENVDLDPKPARYRSSADEISKANEAIGWPLKYLIGMVPHARAASLYALAKACEIAEARIAKAEGMAQHTLRRRAGIAYGRIADGLNRDKVPVR